MSSQRTSYSKSSATPSWGSANEPNLTKGIESYRMDNSIGVAY